MKTFILLAMSIFSISTFASSDFQTQGYAVGSYVVYQVSGISEDGGTTSKTVRVEVIGSNVSKETIEISSRIIDNITLEVVSNSQRTGTFADLSYECEDDKEEITVPAGTFETCLIESEDKSKKMYAGSVPFALVRYVQPSSTTELVEYEYRNMED